MIFSAAKHRFDSATSDSWWLSRSSGNIEVLGICFYSCLLGEKTIITNFWLLDEAGTHNTFMHGCFRLLCGHLSLHAIYKCKFSDVSLELFFGHGLCGITIN